MNLQQVTELLPPVVIQIADLIGFPEKVSVLSAANAPLSSAIPLATTIQNCCSKNLLVNLCISLVVSELYASCGMFVSSQNLMKLIRTALLR